MFALVSEFLEFTFLMLVYTVIASCAGYLAIRLVRWNVRRSAAQEMERDVRIARFKARAAARSAARLS